MELHRSRSESKDWKAISDNLSKSESKEIDEACAKQTPRNEVKIQPYTSLNSSRERAEKLRLHAKATGDS